MSENDTASEDLAAYMRAVGKWKALAEELAEAGADLLVAPVPTDLDRFAGRDERNAMREALIRFESVWGPV